MDASTLPPTNSELKVPEIDNSTDDKSGNSGLNPREKHRRISSGPISAKGRTTDMNQRIIASGPISSFAPKTLRSVAEKAGWKAVGSRLSGHVNGSIPIPQRLPSPQEVTPMETEEPQKVDSRESSKQSVFASSNHSTSVDRERTEAHQSPSSTESSKSIGRSFFSFTSFRKAASPFAPPKPRSKEWPMPSPVPSYKMTPKRPGRTRLSSKSWAGDGWDPAEKAHNGILESGSAVHSSNRESTPKMPPIVELEVPTLVKTCLENRKNQDDQNTFVMMIVPEGSANAHGADSQESKLALKVSCKFEVCEPPYSQEKMVGINGTASSGYHIIPASEIAELTSSDSNEKAANENSVHEITVNGSSVKVIPVSCPIVNIPKKATPVVEVDKPIATPTLSRRNSLGSSSTTTRLFDSFTSLMASKKSPFVSASGPIPSTHRHSKSVSGSPARVHPSTFSSSSNSTTSTSSSSSSSSSSVCDSACSPQAVVILTCPQNSAQSSSTNPILVSPSSVRMSPFRSVAGGTVNHSNHNSSNDESYNMRAYRLPPPPLADTCRPVSIKS